jgi:hypothetical protein
MENIDIVANVIIEEIYKNEENRNCLLAIDTAAAEIFGLKSFCSLVYLYASMCDSVAMLERSQWEDIREMMTRFPSIALNN